MSAGASTHDRAIGAGVVRFGADRREPSAPIVEGRTPRPGQRCIAEFDRSLDDVPVGLRSSDCVASNDVRRGAEVAAPSWSAPRWRPA